MSATIMTKTSVAKPKRKCRSNKSKNCRTDANQVNEVNNCNGIESNDTCVVSEDKMKSKSTNKNVRETKKNGLNNHLITEYYPTLSSTRRRLTAKALEVEREKVIKYYLSKNCDPKEYLAVKEFGDKGKGVVATTSITKGSFICEYSGQLVDMDKAKTKEVKYALVGAGCYMYYFQWNSKIWCVDATRPTGRLGRLINHSRKSPNCKTKLIELNGKPHLVFIALRDINENEEIVYDYGETNKEAIKEHPWLTST